MTELIHLVKYSEISLEDWWTCYHPNITSLMKHTFGLT